MPTDAKGGGYAPLFHPPPPPPPPPSPPVIHVGTSVRSLTDCALGATATVVRLEPGPVTTTAHVEIRPDHWLEGYIFLLGVSGELLDIGQSNHASRLPPSIDASGTMVVFGFGLTEQPSRHPVVELAVKGASLQMRQLTCRPAPGPPPAFVDDDGYGGDVVPKGEQQSSFLLFDASISRMKPSFSFSLAHFRPRSNTPGSAPGHIRRSPAGTLRRTQLVA